MALSLNNPLVFNTAFAGCLAGQVQGSALSGVPATDNAAATYAAQAAVAVAFATEVDSLIPQGSPGAIANVSAGHATIPPTSAAEASTQSAYGSAMFGLSFGYWSQRKSANITASGDAGATPADYAAPAAAIAAQFAEVVTALNAAAVGSLV
jgi:hypothetical protein